MNKDFTIFFSSDPHGSERCWLKFVNAAKVYQAQALIMGGDLTGKAIVPIVRNDNGYYEIEFLGQRSRLAKEELPDAEKRIRFNGFYPYVCDSDCVSRLKEEPEYLDGLFKELINEQLTRWLAIAEERLEPQGVPCFVMAGNDDSLYVDDILNTNPYVINPDMKIVSIGPYQVLSCSWTPPTPWNSPHECSEEELLAKLRPLVNQLQQGVPTIFNLHSPPYRTSLDDAPELRADFSTVAFAGEPKLIPVGSHTVRTLIEEVQPLVALHGHIHESRGVMKIGRTTCVNPGSAYSDGILHGCLVKLKGDELRTVQLLRG